MSKILIKTYLRILMLKFELRKILFGFENANHFLSRMDKRVVERILIENGAKIGKSSDIEAGVVLHNCKGFRYQKLVIGNHCHIGKGVFIDLADDVILHDNITVSMGAKIITHLDAGKSDLAKKYPRATHPVVIQSHCYIGANAVILSGVELGTGCLVAAGSVVTQSFLPYTLIAGVPAKMVKKIDLTC